MKKILTLSLIYKHPYMLLGMKKRGFGIGKWNGFGGKVELGETIYEAARREVEEEAKLAVKSMDHIGILDFQFSGDPVPLEVHCFRITDFDGEPVETEEMRPMWFPIDEIPFKAMWPSDAYWMPLFLKGNRFYGKFNFDGEIVTKHYLEPLAKFD